MDRRGYLLHKLLSALVTLALVVVFNFALFRLLPGDPVTAIARSPRLTREARENLGIQFGLDKPLLLDLSRLASGDLAGTFDTQFTAYVSALLRGNLGISFSSRQPVMDLLAERVWRTVVLVIAAEALAFVFGIALGLVAAWRRGSRLDTSIVVLALLGWGLPTFFLGVVLLLVAQGHLPVGGMVTPGLKPGDGWAYWSDVGRHLVLPTLTMTIIYTSSYILVMRSSVMQVLNEDYILSAKAKGMSTFRILRSEALRNAMLPMVTIGALNLAYTVGGAIQVETVFSWPGIGRLMYEAVTERDYPVLQGTFLLLAVAVIVANFAADLLYSLLDPRVKARQV